MVGVPGKAYLKIPRPFRSHGDGNKQDHDEEDRRPFHEGEAGHEGQEDDEPHHEGQVTTGNVGEPGNLNWVTESQIPRNTTRQAGATTSGYRAGLMCFLREPLRESLSGSADCASRRAGGSVVIGKEIWFLVVKACARANVG